MVKKKKKRKNTHYGRKYLEDIGIKYYDTPQGLCEKPHEKKDKNYNRKKWHEERLIYGFDERETWCLYHTVNLFLYERLMYFKEIGGQTIDLSYHKIEYQDVEYTLSELIDKMIEGLRLDITLDDYDDKRINNPIIRKKIDDVWPIYSIVKYYLWW